MPYMWCEVNRHKLGNYLQKINRRLCSKCDTERKRIWRNNNREAYRKSAREYNYRRGKSSMSDNKKCPLYLGVHIAERVLKNIFTNVKVMPPNNKGYDFVCNKGKKIDVKSSCMHSGHSKSPRWNFTIKGNTTSDYFLCIAFDDRINLNPLYVWLLPSDIYGGMSGVTISTTTIDKWDMYKIDIEKVVNCCDEMKQSRVIHV